MSLSNQFHGHFSETGRTRLITRLAALILALTLLAASLAACDDGGNTDGGGGGSTVAPGGSSTTGQADGTPVAAPQVPDTGCTTEWPRRVQPTTTVAAELKYLAEIVACVNERTGGVTLTNTSSMVWGFSDSSTATEIQGVAWSGGVAAFHAMFPNESAFMAPGETVRVVGGVATLEWAIHPDLSSAWLTYDFLMKQAAKKGQAIAKEWLTAGSATNKVAWECTKAVFDVGIQTPKIINPESYDPLSQLKAGFGVANSAGACGTSWKAAQREAGATKISTWAQAAEEFSAELKPAGETFKKVTTLRTAVVETFPKIAEMFIRYR